LDHWRHSAVDRRATDRDVVEHGHRSFKKRRAPLMIRGGDLAADA
jgi:hypothetical protein